MASIAINMLGDSINAFVYSDPEMARTVRNRDNEVDDLYARVVEEEIGAMEKSRSEVRPGVYNIILALNIERIADLATNIAEDVIYLVDGRMIRHGEEEEPFEAPSDLIKGGPPGESKRRALGMPGETRRSGASVPRADGSRGPRVHGRP
jgi:hypothetical protein